ncbi:DUF3460 family protein [Massilia sp. PWRC2]|uniref:DUF3460 family protein n=1 Tax=Massilia sp. PWRC2 TaxID=2804626 RepID=UPI003CF9D7A8
MNIGKRTGKLRYRTAPYVSDFEQFIDQYMEANPAVVAARQRGWQQWWDRRVELADLAVPLADVVPVRGYAYK